jgi:glucose-1-phosphatase
MTNSSIRLVCFDLGGVLIRICRNWPEAIAAAGFPLRGSLPVDSTNSNGLHDLSIQFGTGRIDLAAFASQASRSLQHSYSPDEIIRIHHAVLRDEFDGVERLIDRIHDSGLTTACLSNTNHAHWERMGEFPAVMKLRHRLASHELGLHKPDEAIYRTLEQSLGFIGPQILFFDDLPENVHAARAIGWDAVHIDHERSTSEQIEAAAMERGLLPITSFR